MNIVITGASRGIGKAVAEIFASHGHYLYLCSRSATQIYKATEELMTRFPQVTIKALPVNLSQKEEVKKFAGWCLDQVIPDVLVNNAGLFEPGSVHHEAEGVLESQMAVNFYSAYHLSRALLPEMMKRQSGHIFNMCSIAALRAYENGGAYSISKAALHSFSKNLREEMKIYGIKVTTVLAGAVLTDSWEDLKDGKKRIMDPSDIAKMIYAASQLSPQACVEEILIRPQLGDL